MELCSCSRCNRGGVTGQGSTLVGHLGTPKDSQVQRPRPEKLLRRAGVRWVRLHDLRHTCASLLLAQGVPARVVMETLGHSAIAVTMNTYSHVLPSLQREAADRMNDVLA